MPSTYSPLLGFELPADGEQAGTWGQTTNRNVGALIEQAIAGFRSITLADANYTLTDFNGVEDESRNMIIRATGILTAARDIIAPATSKMYAITNATTGGFNVIIKTLTGTGVAINPSQTSIVYCDGLNFVLVGGSTVSPAFTGVPTAPTATAGTSTTQIATTAFTMGAIATAISTAVTNAINAITPIGSVKLHFGAIGTIPAGWQVMDGTNGTPDWRNRFIVGAGGLYAPGATGGSADAIIVSHSHSVNDPGHGHGLSAFTVNAGGGPLANNLYTRDPKWGGLQTTPTSVEATGVSINSTGSSGANANLPPYYAAFWIMRMS
jgi:hypothetical protein